MAALVLKSNIFASGWAVFVEMTIVQLQDIEQVIPNPVFLAWVLSGHGIVDTAVALDRRWTLLLGNAG